MAINGARNYRPRFHYTPEKGWINDPNGLLFDGKTYHLFAQHYPSVENIGPMHWSHAVSDDLIHWRHLPIALYPDHLGACWSGSGCVIGGKIALMYTSTGETQQQSVAFSEDGVHFTPWPGNPVIPNPGVPDYRDPKLFWNDVLGKYGVAVAAGDHVEFFASEDLIHWQETGRFSDQARVSGIHECPDVFPLTAPDGSRVFVMIASMILPDGSGNHTQYVLGDFDGHTYRITHPFDQPDWIDAGYDDYAPVTFWGLEEKIMIGWARDWAYAHRLPTGDFLGAMTCPRKLSLKETLRGLRMAQEPLMDAITGAYKRTAALPGECFRIRLQAEGDFRLTLKNVRGEKLTLGRENEAYFIDRRQAGEWGKATEIPEKFGVARRERYVSGKTEMDVLFDVSLLEAFADGGTYAATMAAFPTAPYTRVEAEGCTFEIAELKE